MFKQKQVASDVEIKRTDDIRNDVSASWFHLSERAEERRRAAKRDNPMPTACEGARSRNDLRKQCLANNTDQAPASTGGIFRTVIPARSRGRRPRQALKEEKVDQELPAVIRQTSLITAERTDNASWDVRNSLAVGGEKSSSCLLC